MGLRVCEDCRREISDRAAACPHCGNPVNAVRNQPSGRAWIFAGLAVLVIIGIAWPQPESRGPAPAPPAPASTPPRMSPVIEMATVDKFTGMPGIRHVEWLDGDFIIGALDNGQSWQPVAEAACGWIRRQGAPDGFSVIVLEFGAMQNKTWRQMGRARCR